MSCGTPHEVDCSEILTQAFLYLDGEMGDGDCSRVRQHLDECAPCLRAYGLEEEFKRLVARSCGGEHAPVEMKHRLVARLQEVRLEITQVEYRPE